MNSAGTSSLVVSPVTSQQTNGPNSAPGASCVGGPFCRDGLPWTETEDESLRVAWADPAWTYDDIGAALGRSPSKVKGRANKLRLGTRRTPGKASGARWTAEDSAQLVALRRQGLSNLEIGRALGRTRFAIERRVCVMDLPKRPPPANVLGRPKTEPPKRPQNPINEAELLRRGINPQTVALLRRMK